MTIPVFTRAAPRDPYEWPCVNLTVTAPGALPSWPYNPPVIDWEAPIPDDDTEITRVQVAVSTIRDFRWLGEILTADVAQWSDSLEGTGTVSIKFPTSDPSAIPTLLGEWETWGDLFTGRPKLIDRAVHIVVDGKVDGSYVLRSDAKIADGTVTLSGQEAPRLFADRIIGTGRRYDNLGGRGHFPAGYTASQLGINFTLDGPNWGWVEPGVRGGRSLRIKGDPARNRFTIGAYKKVTRTESFRVLIRASAYVQVPKRTLDDTSLISVAIYTADGTRRIWPSPGQPNPYAANTEEDMPRGEWGRSPITAAGMLPDAPYEVLVIATFTPAIVEEGIESFGGAWTYFDEIELFVQDTVSTGEDPVDLVDQQATLIRYSQDGLDKSSWSLPVVRGASVGVEETGNWRHEDEQPLPDALSAITSRDDGPDPAWVDNQWRCHVGARRGTVRDDLTLGPDLIVSVDGWSHDAGAMVSSMRGVTDRGEAYWRVESVVTDTTHTEGHVIERQARAPNDIELLALDEWTRAQLAQVSQPQETTRVLVPWWLGVRIGAGDSFRVVWPDGYWRLDGRMRVSQRTKLPGQRLVALDLGADVEPD